MGVDVIGEGEHMDVTHSLYEPGKRGPGPHIHRRHSDSFYVLEGELEFGVGPRVEPVRLGAGGFVLVPPGVVHTFLNPGPGEARFLNFHAPSMGFADYLRGNNDDFDAFDPPEDGGRPVTDVLIRERAENGASTDHLSLSETTLAPESAHPPAPDGAAGFVYVLEGTLTLRRGEQVLELGPRDHAYWAAGAAHACANESEAPVRFLHIRVP